MTDLLLLVKSCHDSILHAINLAGVLLVKMTKCPGWHAVGASDAVELCVDVHQQMNLKMIA